jgi:L-lactate dehydrogenase complex protein LldE
MRVGLFIPCYIDQFYPDVGMATAELLERFGCQVEFPEGQSCCGQPMANTGVTTATAPLAKMFVEIFESFDHVVCPSGSCVSMVRNHYEDYHCGPSWESFKGRVWELCEFLTDVLKVEQFDVCFPHRVGLHRSCHGLRELRLDGCSERMDAMPSKVESLLRKVEGLQLVTLDRPDECCGFGGTFAVQEVGVSILMGKDRLEDHAKQGAEVITATDMSCLMHLEGLARRLGNQVPFLHVAQILAGRVLPSTSNVAEMRK